MKKFAEGVRIHLAPPPVRTFSAMPAAESTSLTKIPAQDF